MSNDNLVQVTMSREQLAWLEELRREHAIPELVGDVMPYVEEDRKFGEPYKANPPAVTRLKSPQAWVDKWANNLQAVGETNYRAGIANPKKDWQQASIQGQGAYETAMRDPKTLARRESSIRSVSSDEWAAQAERGASRLVQGALDRRPKTERKVQALHQLMSSHLAKIDQMDSSTPQAREQRMLANVRGMREFKGRV